MGRGGGCRLPEVVEISGIRVHLAGITDVVHVTCCLTVTKLNSIVPNLIFIEKLSILNFH